MSPYNSSLLPALWEHIDKVNSSSNSSSDMLGSKFLISKFSLFQLNISPRILSISVWFFTTLTLFLKALYYMGQKLKCQQESGS